MAILAVAVASCGASQSLVNRVVDLEGVESSAADVQQVAQISCDLTIEVVADSGFPAAREPPPPCRDRLPKRFFFT